jgi:ribonucleoside-diphosphate reductase alpha chain
VAKSPYYKATANDIDWVNKVKMQGEMQKWVDHSISVTVNVPAETTEELVSEIYQTAWECGCKGMTIYRDGSRTGVLVSNKKEEKKNVENDIIETHSPIRPKTLECDVVRFQNNYEKWIAFVGKINNKPYEIFLGKQDDFYLPPFVETAWITKNKGEDGKSRYDLQFQDKQGYKVTIEGLSRSFSPEFWNYAKLISGILRHGMPITNVVTLIQNLSVNEDNINAWKNGIARALKRYIPDGTKVDKEVCPTCGEALVYEDGCKHCKNCGYSKCG